MVSQIIQESALTLALVAVCLLAVATVLVVSVHAHRQGTVLRRWNTRNRRELPAPGSRRRRRSPWTARSVV
jgi:cell division protein FtsL